MILQLYIEILGVSDICGPMTLRVRLWLRIIKLWYVGFPCLSFLNVLFAEISVLLTLVRVHNGGYVLQLLHRKTTLAVLVGI